MTTRICVICGEQIGSSASRTVAALWHFRPIERRSVWYGYLRGTYQVIGLRAALTLLSPLLNTVLNWKYRKARLTSQFNALDDLD